MKAYIHLLLLAVMTVCCYSCTSQSSSPFAPEEGTYTGSTLNVTGTMSYLYNPVTGFGVQAGTSVTPGVNLLGDLLIKSDGADRGTYHFTKLTEWKGSWKYDRTSDHLQCSGPLKDALKLYHAGKGFYSFTIVVQGNGDGITYYFSKKASRDLPKPPKPNGDLQGLLTVKPDLNTVAYLDAASGKLIKSFAARTALTNRQHQTIDIGFTDNTKYYEINITDSQGKRKQLSSDVIMGYKWNFFNYKYGVLNADGSKIALLGQTPDSYFNLTYTPGFPAVGVFDLNGNTLGQFPLETNKLVIPAFLPDGRLVYCPKAGGIAVTDDRYTRSTVIYQTPINAFALSPNGRRVVFSEGLHFYMMNIDGTGKQQIVCDKVALQADNADNVITMDWSPDGKHFAVSYKAGSGFTVLIVPFDGGSYRFLRDEDGETFQHAGQLISWH